MRQSGQGNCRQAASGGYAEARQARTKGGGKPGGEKRIGKEKDTTPKKACKNYSKQKHRKECI